MIVGVCADKGSPGVTTLATALAIAWPGRRLLLEADPSGGDLAFRARAAATGELLADRPGLLTLAADARGALPAEVLPHYAQATAWGVPVVVGPPGAQSYTPVRALWPAVAQVAAAWPGTVIADLGRLQPGNPAVSLARAATAVLVLAEVSVEGLYHLRERVNELAHVLGDPTRSHNPVAVVVAAGRKDAGSAVRQVTHLLQAGGSPIPVAGVAAVDPVAAQQLREGQLSKRAAAGDLLTGARELAATVCAWWPQLAVPADQPQAVAPGPGAPDGGAVDTASAMARFPQGTR